MRCRRRSTHEIADVELGELVVGEVERGDPGAPYRAQKLVLLRAVVDAEADEDVRLGRVAVAIVELRPARGDQTRACGMWSPSWSTSDHVERLGRDGDLVDDLANVAIRADEAELRVGAVAAGEQRRDALELPLREPVAGAVRFNR